MISVNDSKPYFLYIEDDEEDVELLKYVLEGTQFDIEMIHRTNGVDALDFLEKCKLYNRLPELIFLDINLSKMDGRETLLCLKADKDIGRIPVTILSTSSLDKDVAYFRQFHVPYIVKPGDINRYKEEVIDVMKCLLAFEYDFNSLNKNSDAA
jgi:CheY-like chemotaxis protein